MKYKVGFFQKQQTNRLCKAWNEQNCDSEKMLHGACSLNDWLVFNANFSSISAISWRACALIMVTVIEQILNNI